jgi:hypothetical protein
VEKLNAQQKIELREYQDNYGSTAELIKRETPERLLLMVRAEEGGADILEELPSDRMRLEERLERIEVIKECVSRFDLQPVEEGARKGLLVRCAQLRHPLEQALRIVNSSRAEQRDQTNLTVSTISMVAAVVAGIAGVAALIVAIVTLTKMH